MVVDFGVECAAFELLALEVLGKVSGRLLEMLVSGSPGLGFRGLGVLMIWVLRFGDRC